LLLGYGKLTGYAGTVRYMGLVGVPAPGVFTVLAIIIEIGAGLLVLVGYKTRLVCLGLAVYVLVSAFIGHSQLDDLNQFQHFMKNMAIVGGSLAFVAFGGGAYFLDARSRSQRLRPSRLGRPGATLRSGKRGRPQNLETNGPGPNKRQIPGVLGTVHFL